MSSDEAETMYDVIIVGAGPVGSTAALLADRQGLRALLVDTSPEVYPEPRAIHFDADVMRIFQFAGIANELESQVRATAGALHLGADGEPIRDFRVTAVDGDLGWKPHYMFYQPQVDALLRRRAADAVHVSAQFGWRCEHIMQHADHVSIELRSDLGAIRHEQAKYLIAADGASSTIRKSFGVNLSDYGFEEPWIIVDGHVENEQLGPDYSIMYCDPSRPATYVPGPRGHRRWEFMLLPGEDGAAYTSPEGAWSLIGGITPWLQESEISFERAAIYKFHALVADRWRIGRVFLAGDAAHQTPPFYGQGMCHGIRDVRNVLWKIAAVITHNADDALLDTYQIEREPHVRSVIGQSVENGRYICILDPELARQRDVEMRARAAAPTHTGRTFRDVIPGLINGILESDPRSSAVGLLFPQPWVGVDGKRTRLDDLLRDDWAVIRNFESPTASSFGLPAFVIGRDLEDVDGILAEWFEAFDCDAVIVRPDHYVFGATRGPEELTARIREVFDQLGANYDESRGLRTVSSSGPEQ